MVVYEYHGKPIFYGLGNFCYDWIGQRNINWNIGYLVNLDFDQKKDSFEIVPYIQFDKQPLVLMMNEAEKNNFMKGLDKINSVIQDRVKLSDEVKHFMSETSEGYKLALEPYTGRISQKLYSMNLLPSFCKGKKKVLLKNLLRCESHYERLLASLE